MSIEQARIYNRGDMVRCNSSAPIPSFEPFAPHMVGQIDGVRHVFDQKGHALVYDVRFPIAYKNPRDGMERWKFLYARSVPSAFLIPEYFFDFTTHAGEYEYYEKVAKYNSQFKANPIEKIVKEKEETSMAIPTNALVPVKIIYNYPATIVFWKDGTKTVVQCSENDLFDEQAGFKAALAKKLYGHNHFIQKMVDGRKVYDKKHKVPDKRLRQRKPKVAKNAKPVTKNRSV